MKAFILCAGMGSRLRPLTFGFPKASIPFLNLPLLYYNWFYLEQMGLTHAVLNSHLFPEILKETASRAKAPNQQVNFSFEPQSLGSAGGLFSLKSFFAEETSFLYLNGDSLFFPSRKEMLDKFLSQEKHTPLGIFWATPLTPENTVRALWIDRDHTLRAIGGEDQVQKKGFQVKNSKDLSRGDLRPVRFNGLALFKKEIFNFLSPKTEHIFQDAALPLLKEGGFKVFLDEEGVTFEGGEMGGLLTATDVALNSLFSEKPSFIRDWLLKIFQRFDPSDQTVGLKRGRSLKQKKGRPLLCPESVKGLDLLQVKNFAVLGKNVSFTGQSLLNSAILGERLSWRGSLKNQILMKFHWGML